MFFRRKSVGWSSGDKQTCLPLQRLSPKAAMNRRRSDEKSMATSFAVNGPQNLLISLRAIEG
jgi:hypothetical protein